MVYCIFSTTKGEHHMVQPQIQILETLYGHIYDYSNSVYKGSDKRIEIKHIATQIVFEQAYNLHKKGKLSSHFNFKFIQYIEKCNVKFNNRYRYSCYKGYNCSVTIHDTVNNEIFIMNAQSHYQSETGRVKDCLNSFSVFKKRAKEVRGNNYKYLEYLWDERKVKYKCLDLDKIYVQNIYDHLADCVLKEEKSDRYFQDFKIKANLIHNNLYEYSDFKSVDIPITVRNKITGEVYTQRIQHVLDKHKPILENRKYNFQEFIDIASDIYQNRFIYSNYVNLSSSVDIFDCETLQSYSQLAFNHLKSLPKDLSLGNRSKLEKRIVEEVKNLYPNLQILESVRPSWLQRKELDILIPELNLAIEVNGTIYHHSSTSGCKEFYLKTRVDSNYHLDKALTCLENNIKLIHLFDFEILQPNFDLQSILDLYLSNDIIFEENECIHVHPNTLKVSSEGLKIFKPIVKII